MSRKRLDDGEVRAALEGVPSWAREGDAIQRKLSLPTFRDAQRFVNRLCDLAEGLNHHPELHWVYVHVTVGLSTHDAGGLTSLDFHLARCVDEVARDFGL